MSFEKQNRLCTFLESVQLLPKVLFWRRDADVEVFRFLPTHVRPLVEPSNESRDMSSECWLLRRVPKLAIPLEPSETDTAIVIQPSLLMVFVKPNS